MITNILYDNAKNHRVQISELKAKAPMYPEIHFEAKGGCIWATTIAMITRNNTGYKLHFVDYAVGGSEHIDQLKARITAGTMFTLHRHFPPVPWEKLRLRNCNFTD